MGRESNTDWKAIVDQAADRLQTDFPGLTVSAEARAALVDRVNQHREAAEAQLREGAATQESVSQAAYEQLLDAVHNVPGLPAGTRPSPRSFVADGPTGPHTIRQQDVVLSMQRRCQWIPWC